MPTLSTTIPNGSTTIIFPNSLGESAAQVSVQGTYAGITINFFDSNDGGSSYFAVAGVRDDNNTGETSVALGTNAPQLWTIPIAGKSHLKITSTAWTSGVADVFISSGNFPLPGGGASPTSSVTVTGALPSGSNTIGHVVVTGALPSGSNTIGNVGVTSLPTPVQTASQGGSVVLNQASAAQVANGNSTTLTVSSFSMLILGVNITAVSGSLPVLELFLDNLGADSIWYTIWSSATQTSTGNVIASIGQGLQHPHIFGNTIRLRWVITGSTPSFTFSASILGK